MVPFIYIGSIRIASYGLMIAVGLIVANTIACILRLKNKENLTDIAILEAYAIGGALFGAIALRVITIAKYVNWSYIGEPGFFEAIFLSGLVFYGGLIGALLAVIIAGKVHRINAFAFLDECAFMIPIMHGFGRIGCHLAGCCYGMPYHGPFAVTFPEDTLGLPGVPLFPVQLTESAILMILGIILLIRSCKGKTKNNILIYAMSYSVIRFCLEYIRYDSIRGKFLHLSTSQWISVIIFVLGLVVMVRRHYRRA